MTLVPPGSQSWVGTPGQHSLEPAVRAIHTFNLHQCPLFWYHCETLLLSVALRVVFLCVLFSVSSLLTVLWHGSFVHLAGSLHLDPVAWDLSTSPLQWLVFPFPGAGLSGAWGFLPHLVV